MSKHIAPFVLVALLGGVVAFGSSTAPPDVVSAARGGPPGAPGGGGDAENPDYGDLIILLRDDAGVPIPSDPVSVPDPESGQVVDGGLCWQPVAAVDFSFEGWDPPPDRVVVPTTSTAVDGGYLIPVDQYNCAVEAYFATYTQEVDFGRLNEARSPATVLESQLEDVLVKLATADSASLDPAGRMVASTCGMDEPTVTATIDSPLQNLAVYRQLMLTGSIGVGLPRGAGFLETAARGVGVASDKTGEVNVDMVVYLNQLMGLDVAPTILPKLTETYREEVQGTIQLVTKSFIDYGAFGYERGTTFGALPSPAYVPGGAPVDGTFEYLAVLDESRPTFQIVRGPIMTAVFSGTVFSGSGIAGFAQAADDTRAVIEFMHDWPIPNADVYGTPVPCHPDPELVTYDVSISDVSGLQVPKMLVDGSEGREFIVTIANAGPDAATGAAWVTATAANGVAIEGSPWQFPFAELPAGTSIGFTEFFSVALGERTTIEWTAFADAEFDVNLANNTVNATTSIKVTGGGGRP